jgi:hypothetical protein
MSYTPLLSTHTISVDLPTHVNENFRTARFLNIASKTATFDVFDDDTSGSPKDLYLCDATSGAITADLPAAASHSGRVVTVKKTDASGNAVTLDGNSSETIDGATTKVLASQYDCASIVSDGTEWHLLSEI